MEEPYAVNAQPVSIERAASAKLSLLSYLGIAVAGVVVVFFLFSWLNTRQASTITFLATPRSQIAVDVRGAISTPGVIYLEPGSRLIDVIDTSGGMSPNADQSLVNLSSRVVDGQMIVIPTRAPIEDPSTLTGLININSASIDELKELPGIGDVLAQRIVAYREFNGPFQSTDELGFVDGISPALVESLAPYVTVSDND